ncbi:hypothetical protein JW826_03590 [Candidatus Woesearchaeota archaeon]|nr:hypothetical protein [Candidatus Woesearchaeota archaeon]
MVSSAISEWSRVMDEHKRRGHKMIEYPELVRYPELEESQVVKVAYKEKDRGGSTIEDLVWWKLEAPVNIKKRVPI